MAVPNFQMWFSPLLRSISDGKEHEMSILYESLADEMKMSDEDRSILLKSGGQFLYQNRVGWARTYLKKAGLLESPRRGAVKITEKGLEVVKKNLEIDIKYLKQFNEFLDFHTYKGPKESDFPDIKSDINYDDETPEESIDRIIGSLNNQLAFDLIEKIKSCTPQFFEKLVVNLLLKMGYGGSNDDAGKITGKSGDGGIDGVINEDKLGLDVIYIQAKKWENQVGRPQVQAFAGSLEGVRARKGVFITTSNFSSEAREYVRQIEKKIVLIDGKQLALLMIQHDVGVAIENEYKVKKIDSDFFE